MAERRMFAKTIVLSDAFLDMPMSARCLYFTLGMLADDDGFVNAPRSIMRQCGASDDDMKLLITKKFVLIFDSGVIVIKHWRINNYLQKDRIQPTKYIEEKSTLSLDEKGGYTRSDSMYTDTVYTQNSIGKVRLEEDSVDKDRLGEEENNNSFFLSNGEKIADVISYYTENFDTEPARIEYIKAMAQTNPDKVLAALQKCVAEDAKSFARVMKAVREA